MAESTLPAGDAAPKDTEAPAPAAPVPDAGPVDTQTKADEAPKAKEPGPAQRRLAEIRERKAANAAKAAEAASNIDPAVLDAAKRWQAHEAAESKRISEAAAGLDAEDRALIDGENDLGRKAALLARLQRAASAAPAPKGPREVAKAGPSGSPPSVVDLDLAEALKTPEGFAAAKQAPGFKEKFSAMLNGSARKSTLDVAREAGRK